MSKFEKSVFENVKAECKKLANQGANYRTLANYVEGVISFYKKQDNSTNLINALQKVYSIFLERCQDLSNLADFCRWAIHSRQQSTK